MGRAVATVEGLDKLGKALQQMPRKVRALLRDMIQESAEAAAAVARQHVPVRDGDLYRAIAVSGRGVSWAAGLEDMNVGSRRGASSHTNPSVYGKFVEYGTARTGAKPFMRPAAESESQKIPDRLRDVARKLPGEF